MAGHRAVDKERSIRIPSRAAEFPSRSRTKSGRCERSTCTSPKGPPAGLRSRTRREQRATARTQPRRRSTMHRRKFRTRRASALAACRRFASRVAFEPRLENAWPALTHARQSTGRAGLPRPRMRLHTQTQAVAESQIESANTNFPLRKIFGECFRR